MKKKIFYTLVLLGIIVVGWYFFQMNEPMVVINTPLEEMNTFAVSSTTTATSTARSSSVKSRKVITQKVVVAPKDEYVVNYTENGFEPDELKIPRGVAVKFVNKTSASMRIFASQDAKPPFSDLNQPKALGRNGEYVFNFVYSGIWSYYNSLKPEDVAHIVVY